MTKIKKKMPGNFTVTPNKLLYDPAISLQAKGLWSYINSKPDNWNFAAERISQETKEGRDSIKKAFRELIAAGYLLRTRLSSGSFEYTLHMQPSTENQPGGSSTEKPSTENATEGNPVGLVKKEKEVISNFKKDSSVATLPSSTDTVGESAAVNFEDDFLKDHQKQKRTRVDAIGNPLPGNEPVQVSAMINDMTKKRGE